MCQSSCRPGRHRAPTTSPHDKQLSLMYGPSVPEASQIFWLMSRFETLQLTDTGPEGCQNQVVRLVLLRRKSRRNTLPKLVGAFEPWLSRPGDVWAKMARHCSRPSRQRLQNEIDAQAESAVAVCNAGVLNLMVFCRRVWHEHLNRRDLASQDISHSAASTTATPWIESA